MHQWCVRREQDCINLLFALCVSVRVWKHLDEGERSQSRENTHTRSVFGPGQRTISRLPNNTAWSSSEAQNQRFCVRTHERDRLAMQMRTIHMEASDKTNCPGPVPVAGQVRNEASGTGISRAWCVVCSLCSRSPTSRRKHEMSKKGTRCWLASAN